MKINAKKLLTNIHEHDNVDLVMVRGYTRSQVVGMLKAHLGERSQADLAREIGISRGYLADVLSGRVPPGPTILPFLGLEAGYIKPERAA